MKKSLYFILSFATVGAVAALIAITGYGPLSAWPKELLAAAGFTLFLALVTGLALAVFYNQNKEA